MRNGGNKFIMIYRRCRRGFHRYINGTKGVISLLLAILMLPFITVAGSLINAARVNSAIAVFDEALCNASNSTLGTYDEFLRERFGLLAMNQNTASQGSGYTAQNLISDTFKFYMEENLGVLSNTYTSYDVSATGVYPLADTDVLLSQVFEYSKYTVPTKLLINGLSLDNLMENLTDSLSLSKSIMDTISSGAGMVEDISKCDEKLNKLKEKITASETAKAEYDTAYNAFVGAVSSYNNLVDEFTPKYNEKKQKINEASGEVNSCIQTLAQAEAAARPVLEEIAAIENSQLMLDNPQEAQMLIHDLNLEHASTLQAYTNATQALSNANGKLGTANANMTSLQNSYADDFESKRNGVNTAKSTYVTKIDALANALKDTGNAFVESQEAVMKAIEGGTNFLGNVVTTVTESQQKATDKRIDELKKSKTEADERGDSKASQENQKKIQEAQNEKIAIQNANTLGDAYYSSLSNTAGAMQTFATTDYYTLYGEAYGRLINLKSSVQAYSVSMDNLVKCADATSLYETIESYLTVAMVQEIQKNMANEVANSGFFAFMKACVEFIKALLNISIFYDGELNSTINPLKYAGIGGLPSMKDRTDGSPYSLKSGFEEVDQQKSDYYKELLGEYLDNPIVQRGSNIWVNLGDDITASIQLITDTINNWGENNIFTNLGNLGKAALGMIKGLWTFINDLDKMITNAVHEKLLLAGYVAYNIPNRTTYTDSGITGKGYSLPNENSIAAHQGIAFYGAETEYIINGEYSEKSNQTLMFWEIWCIRAICNMFVLPTNKEVLTLIEQAAPLACGLGSLIVLVFYIVCEPLVDTIILCNGGSIPMVKTKVFLTPSGLPALIEKFCQLKLTEPQKEAVSRQAIKTASQGKATDEEIEKQMQDLKNKSNNEEEKKKLKKQVVESLEYDYTKMSLILLIIFVSSDRIADRLADVIQMEATYNAMNRIDQYTFDLDKSFTYIRASGEFETNEFIKISNSTGLNSKERVIYRGY